MNLRSRLKTIVEDGESKPRRERRRRKGTIKTRTFDATRIPEPHPDGHPVPAWAIRVREVLEEKGREHSHERRALRVLRARDERLVNLVDQAWQENKRASLRLFNLEKKIRRDGKISREKFADRLLAAQELLTVTFREYTRAASLLTRVRERRKKLLAKIHENGKEEV